MPRSSARRTVVFCLVLLIMLGGALGWLSVRDSRDAVSESIELKEHYEDATYGIGVSYPTSFRRRELTEQQLKVGYRLRVDQPDPAAFFFLKTERGGRGLGTASALGGVSRLEILRRNTERTLPTLYEGYQSERIDEVELAGQKGFTFTFSYSGPSGRRITQRFTELLRDGSLIYSLIFQAPADRFDVHRPLFEAIERSLTFSSPQIDRQEEQPPVKLPAANQ